MASSERLDAGCTQTPGTAPTVAISNVTSARGATPSINASKNGRASTLKRAPFCARAAALTGISAAASSGSSGCITTTRSWMDPRREAQVEAKRLHDPEGRAGGKDVSGGEDSRVLGDHWRGSGIGARIQIALYPCPGVRAVLLEIGGGIDRRQRLPDAVGDVGHVPLMQRHIVARAEPAEVTADEMLPWVRERFLRRRHVSHNVLGEIHG